MKNLVILTGAGMSAESESVRFVMQAVCGTGIRWSKWLLRKAISATLHW